MVGELLMIPVQALAANEYNPNRMTDSEFAELVAEIEHLGRVPKPIVARPNGEAYLIVDGEHCWRAAQEAGLSEVACEVIEVDEFEAMRQTYKRNQHGTHNPVLLGRMFLRMMEERGLSGRALAEEMDVSEGTVRNALTYVEAAEMRNSYAQAGGDRGGVLVGPLSAPRQQTLEEEISSLSVRQVRTYTSLPKDIRDTWLNAGADSGKLDEALRITFEDESGKKGIYELDMDSLLELERLGLARFADSRNFIGSVRRLGQLLLWRDRFSGYFADPEELDKCLQAAGRLGLPWWVLDSLPASVASEGIELIIPAERWIELVEDCKDRAADDDEFRAIYQAGIRMELRRQGVESYDVTDPRVAEAMAKLEGAPEFIRETEALTLGEKVYLNELSEEDFDGIDAEMLAEVKRRTMETMEKRHEIMTGEGILREVDKETTALVQEQWKDITLDVALEREAAYVFRERRKTEEKELFSDAEELLAQILKGLRQYHIIRERTINERPAIEVLEERLRALPKSEFRLLAAPREEGDWAAIPYEAITLWFKSVGEDQARE